MPEDAPAPTEQPKTADPGSDGGAPAIGPGSAAQDAGDQGASGSTGDTAAPASTLGLADVRQLWPDLVERTKGMRRLTWMLLTQHAQVVGVDQRTLTLGFDAQGPRDSFVGSGGDEVLRQAAIDVIGSDWRIEAIVDPGATPGAGQPGGGPAGGQSGGGPSGGGQSGGDRPSGQSGGASWRDTSSSGDGPSGPAPSGAPSIAPAVDAPAGPAQESAGAPPAWATNDDSAEQPQQDEAPAARPSASNAFAAAREAVRETRSGPSAPEPREDPDADVDPDDPDADSQGLDSAELLKRTLGARVIEQIQHE